MEKTYVMGIDPGANGGIAFVNPQKVDDCFAYKVNGMTLQDIANEIRSLSSSVRLCVIEAVGVMPKQGISSGFKFGVNYGQYMGILTALKIPFINVRPAVWQRRLGCLSGGDKNVTKTKAQNLFAAVEGMKVTHAIADSLLIAYYGATLTNSGEIL